MDLQNKVKYKIQWLDTFKKEVDNIYYYISQILDEPLIAYKFHKKLIQKINSLEYFPERYRKIKSKDSNIRKIIVDQYIILYQVNNKSKKVFILHIFHSSQNYLFKL